jgi:flavin-binding protein dodecin
MPDSVYKVIEIIGSSPTSWEDAASKAISQASKHLKDLRVAEIKNLDIHMLEDGSLAYRTKLDVSFRYHGEG